MIQRDQRAGREITTSALHASIKAVLALIYGPNGETIEEGAIEGVTVTSFCLAVINMNPRSHTAEADFPPRAHRISLPPLQRPSDLPHQLSLTSTRIPDDQLSRADDGTTRSTYFSNTSVNNPFLAILLAPRLFPQKILDTKVYKTPAGSPLLSLVIISYQEG